MSMKVIPRITIDETNFISSNVIEDDYLEWDAFALYGMGDRCMVTQQIASNAQAAVSQARNSHDTTAKAWTQMAINPYTLDMLAAIDDELYMQTASAGAFNSIHGPSAGSTYGQISIDTKTHDTYFVELDSGGTSYIRKLDSLYVLTLHASHASQNWYALAFDSNTADIWVAGPTIVYKQTAAAGAFVDQSFPTCTAIQALAVHNATGDVYVCATVGGLQKIYRRAAVTGSWAAENRLPSTVVWSDVAVDQSTGDAYAAQAGGDIWQRPAGTRKWVLFADDTQPWTALGVCPGLDVNADWIRNLYAVRSGNVDYHQTMLEEYTTPTHKIYEGVVSAFDRQVVLLPGSFPEAWYAVAVNQTTGDIFGLTTGALYKQTEGAGEFVLVTTLASGGTGVAVDETSGDVYITCISHYYIQPGGVGAFTQYASPATWLTGVTVNQTTRDAYFIAYVSTISAIWKRTAGAGAFAQWTGVSAPASGLTAVAADSTRNYVFAVTAAGVIWRWDSGGGAFVDQLVTPVPTGGPHAAEVHNATGTVYLTWNEGIHSLALDDTALTNLSLDVKVWWGIGVKQTAHVLIGGVLAGELYTISTGNIGYYPPDFDEDSASGQWLSVTSTNTWKMFDGTLGPQTIAEEDAIVIGLRPGQFNNLVFFDMDCTEILVALESDADGIIFSSTIDMTEGVADWYEYWFDDITFKADLLLENIPLYSDGALTVKINKPGGFPRCGLVVLGVERILGMSQFGASGGIIDYSIKKRDPWGNANLEPGEFVKAARLDVRLTKGTADRASAMLAAYRATPVVWVGSPLYGLLLLYGICVDFNVIIAGKNNDRCALELEAVV